ncbi:MAG TPA: SDR family oxidoreductase [Anaerolineales bacterium]|nr:SDR family oxidoreductase [Anaerolineales bacterium]
MNKVIVITGATGALGSLTAKTFAEMGASLALLDNDQTKLDALVKELDLPEDRLFTSVADLRDEQAVQDSAKAVANKFGSIHALFHLVGGWIGGKTIADSPLEDLESMLGQHVITTFHLFKAFSPKLAASKWGRVVTISPSTVANPPAERGVYNATKAAQENLVMTLAQELKDSGVTANIIQVHSIDVENKGTGTTPTAIVATMQYLFSEQASKVNGAKIPLY